MSTQVNLWNVKSRWSLLLWFRIRLWETLRLIIEKWMFLSVSWLDRFRGYHSNVRQKSRIHVEHSSLLVPVLSLLLSLAFWNGSTCKGFCFWIVWISFRLSGVPFRVTDSSSDLLDTRNTHLSKPSDTITCSINDQVLVISHCLKQLTNAKISKLSDFRLQNKK